jgi:hypothetical protein
MGEVIEEVGGNGFMFSVPNVNRRTMAEITDGLVPGLQLRSLPIAPTPTSISATICSSSKLDCPQFRRRGIESGRRGLAMWWEFR